ncbi:MAG: hypothetical protein ACFFAS_20035 [Promethearchaeota archaeon]
MKDLSNLPDFKNYFSMINSSETKIKEKDLFFREKYNEILNYFKLVLTNSKTMEVYNYLTPKGTLLINVSPGSDIVGFLKHISENYHLEVMELDRVQIYKNPELFFSNFNEMINAIIEEHIELQLKQRKDENENEQKILIIINQLTDMRESLQRRNLFREFIVYWKDKIEGMDLVNKNALLVWITDDYKEIARNSNDLYCVFDLFVNVPVINRIDRETILKDFSEANPKISFDINAVASHTKDWEVMNLNQLLKVAILKHFLNSDLNETTNEITDIIMELIDSGEFIPSYLDNSYGQNELLFGRTIHEELNDNREAILPKLDDIVNQIQGKGYSEFMLDQLYESAASNNYNELILVLDKLSKREPIEENDRLLLAKYPFILNDTPAKAQIHMEKAKKRVDLIKLAFGRE